MFEFSPAMLLGVQLYVIWRLRGIWRWLAAAPLLMILAFIALIPVLVSFDPRIGHSALPIVTVIFYFGLLWLGLVVLTRQIIRWVTVF
jgi:hypothetical protein